MRRGVLHTTTVRFHADTWAMIRAESHRLGIAHAEFIRCAVLHYIGCTVAADRIGRLERRVETLARIVGLRRTADAR